MPNAEGRTQTPLAPLLSPLAIVAWKNFCHLAAVTLLEPTASNLTTSATVNSTTAEVGTPCRFPTHGVSRVSMSFRSPAGQPSDTRRGSQGMARHQLLTPDGPGFDPADAWIRFDNDELKKLPLAGYVLSVPSIARHTHTHPLRSALRRLKYRPPLSGISSESVLTRP